MATRGGREGYTKFLFNPNYECEGTLVGHTDSVYCVLIGKGLICTGSYDKTIRVSNADSKELTYVLEGHKSLVWCLAFVPGTDFLASGGGDGSIIFFDLSTRKLSHSLPGGHSHCVRSLLTVPGTTLLVSCSEDASVKVWDVVARTCLRALTGHEDHVYTLANVPGNLVASGGYDGSIRVWNPATGLCVRTIARAHPGIIGCYGVGYVVFVPDLDLLASGGRDGSIKLWDVKTGVSKGTFFDARASTNWVNNWVFGLAVVPGTTLLASCSAAKRINIWDVTTRKCVQTLTGHEGTVWGIAADLLTGSLFSVSDDKTLKVWSDPKAAEKSAAGQKATKEQAELELFARAAAEKSTRYEEKQAERARLAKAAVEKADEEWKAAAKRREAQEWAISDAITQLGSKSVEKVSAALVRAVALGVSRDAPSLSPVVLWLEVEAAFASAVDGMHANNAVRARAAVAEAKRFGVTSAPASRLEPVVAWLAREDPIVASLAAMAAGSVTDAKRSLDEALLLGLSSADARAAKVQRWLANEALKEAAIVAAVSSKAAGSATDARRCVEEAQRLGADRNEPRLRSVSSWFAQEDAIASAQAAMTAKKLSDARSSSIEARRLGVGASDPRLKVVLDWLVIEDAKESAVAAAESAVTAKSVPRAQVSYEKALELGVPSSAPRLLTVKAWLDEEAVKEAAIVAAVQSIALYDVEKTKSALSMALAVGVKEDDSRLIDVNSFICSSESATYMAISDIQSVKTALAVAFSRGVPMSNPTIIEVRAWEKVMEQNFVFQKCKESLRALDREKARSTLADALRASVVERTDKRLQGIELWTSDDSSRMLHARLTMKSIEKDFKDHAIVWELIALSGEVLLSAEKKKAHKHVAAASNIVLELAPTLDDLTSKDVSESMSKDVQTALLSLKQSLSSLRDSFLPWEKKSAFEYFSYPTGVLRPKDAVLVDCVRVLEASLIAFNVAFAEGERLALLTQARVAIASNDVEKAKACLYSAIVAGVKFDDPRLGELKMVIRDAALVTRRPQRFAAGGGRLISSPRAQAQASRERILYESEISPDSYQLSLEPIHRAQGPTSANIHLVEIDGRTMCAKVFELVGLTPKEKAEKFSAFKKELAVICQCLHVSIVRVFGATTTVPNRLIMIMEYVQRGSLRQLLDSGVTLSTESKLKILRSIAGGMNYLYSRSTPIQHRDLKSLNVLVDDEDRAKIIDFGLSSSAISMSSTTAAMKTRGGYAGTFQWSAPEVLDEQPFTEKSDVYSFAVITWEVLTGRRPWDDKGLSAASLIRRVVDKCERPSPLPTNVDPRLLALLQTMWAPEPDDRPSFKSILQQLDLVIVSQQDERATGSASAATIPPIPRATTEERKKAMWHEAAKQNAKSICHIDVLVYGGVWETMLKNEGDDLKRLGKSVEKLRSRMPKGKALQPQLGGFETTTPDYLHLLKEAHEDVDKTIFSEAESVSKKLGLKFKRGPNKKNERIFEKADLCYNGDYSQITDLRRGSVICPTVADVKRAVDELLDTPGLDILRLKDRLDVSYNAKEDSLGYRDIQLNVRVSGPIPLIWELQLHIEAMENVKTGQDGLLDAAGRGGHARYKAYRELMERLKKLESDGVFGAPNGRKGGGGGGGGP